MKAPIQYLNSISPLSQKAIDSLSELFRLTVLKEADFFIKEGQYAKDIGFLESGVVRAFFVNKDGKEYINSFLLDQL